MNNQLKIRLVKYHIYSYFLYHLQKNNKEENFQRYERERKGERERDFLKDSVKKITNLAFCEEKNTQA